MTRRAIPIVVCVAVALAMALPAAAGESVSGKWKMTSKTPRGERVSEITLEQTGEKLVVSSQDRQGNPVKSEGTVKGTEITWTTTRTRPDGGEFTIVYTGKVDGKKMTGTMELGQMGTGDWSAERVE